MDISKLVPFIKEALMTVSPEEVAAQLQKQHQSKLEDKSRETIDNDVVEQDEKPDDDLDNDEGQLLEGGFKELDVEEAIEQAKEQKLLSGNPEVGHTPGVSAKIGNFHFRRPKPSYWDLLKTRIG